MKKPLNLDFHLPDMRTGDAAMQTIPHHGDPSKGLDAIMPRKIRELIQELTSAGFYEIKTAGKGSHRKYAHPLFAGAVTLSGKTGDDAKAYQEKQVRLAIEEVGK